jgi:hypothetical protein
MAVGAVLVSAGCVAAAAGLGAGGAIYVTERGVQSVVAAPVDRTFGIAQQTFKELGITESKTSAEQEGGTESRSLDGKIDERDVSVELKTEGPGTKVEVVVKKTAVTWDKDFARRILNRIVEQAK